MTDRRAARRWIVAAIVLIAAGSFFAWRALSGTAPPVDDGTGAGVGRPSARARTPADPGEPAGRTDHPPKTAPEADLSGAGEGAGAGSDPPAEEAGAGAISGEVTLATGGYPDGATVRIAGLDRSESERRTPLDSAGRFRFDDLTPGRWRVAAEHPTLAGASAVVWVEAGRETVLDPIRLRPGGHILVRVVDETDAPIPDEPVRVEGSPSDGDHRRTTDASGVALIGPFAPGRYLVTWDTGARPFEPVTVVPDDRVEVVFRAGGAVRGRLLAADGTPIPNGVIRLVDSEGRTSEVQAPTDAEGRFVVSPLPEGTYEVQAYVHGAVSYLVTLARLTIAHRQVVERDLRLADTRYAGRVVRSDDGEPLDHRSIQISARPADAPVTSPAVGMAFADGDGSFELVGLPPGRYELWFAALAPDFADQRTFVDIGPNASDERVRHEISARTTGVLRATVVEADGSPASGITFTVREEIDGELVERSVPTKTIGEGRFELTLEAGEQKVSVRRRETTFEPSTIPITIVAGATVEATFRIVYR